MTTSTEAPSITQTTMSAVVHNRYGPSGVPARRPGRLVPAAVSA